MYSKYILGYVSLTLISVDFVIWPYLLCNSKTFFQLFQKLQIVIVVFPDHAHLLFMIK